MPLVGIVPGGECGEDGDNLSSGKEFWQVESGLKWIDEAHAAEQGPGIEVFAENGSEPVHLGGGPQLSVPEIELVITNGAGGCQDHFSGYLKNGPDLGVMLQFDQCCVARQRQAQADRRDAEELREHLCAYCASAMLFERAEGCDGLRLFARSCDVIQLNQDISV
jgi:hypothetical protein